MKQVICARCNKSHPEIINVAFRGREVSLCSASCMAAWARGMEACQLLTEATPNGAAEAEAIRNTLRARRGWETRRRLQEEAQASTVRPSSPEEKLVHAKSR
jgi:hypothetical protein